MKRFPLLPLVVAILFHASLIDQAIAQPIVTPIDATDDLDLVDAQVRYLQSLDLLVFEQKVAGGAGQTALQPNGALDGAPVLGYVFPTTLAPRDVGFHVEAGIVALAITSHPDFDDTPLWDEDNDLNYSNDGQRFHAHWVVLAPDERVPGGLSVVEFEPLENSNPLPPTNPGMPMYMDSPGFSIVLDGSTLRVLVPAQRVNHRRDFQFDAVTAYMEVNTSDAARPLLGVYAVYDVLSGDLSLPYTVRQ